MIRILRSHEAAREEILSRGEARVPESVERDVREILAAVRAEGDAAVMAFNAKFGAPQQTALLATREEIVEGYAAVDETIDVSVLTPGVRRGVEVSFLEFGEEDDADGPPSGPSL